MIIPIVNIIVFLIILFSSSVNRSLKNMLLAMILPGIILIVLVVFFGLGSGLLDYLLPN
jgi:membrane protein insertase Oxa1/YidC/SpoIIIJ